MSLSLNRSLSAQESFDDSVFGSVDIPENSQPPLLPPNNPLSTINHATTTHAPEPIASLESSDSPINKPKYNDSSRSDSGICDVAPDPNKP